MTPPERRALFISPIAPDIAGNGLAMRSAMFLEALARVASVDLLVLPVSSSRPAGPFAERMARQVRMIRVAGRVDTQWQLIAKIRSADERLAAFAAYERGSRHAFMSLPVLADVRAAAAEKRYDLVHAERLYVAEAAMAVDTPCRIMDLDEDDAWAWRQSASVGNDAWHEAEARAEDRLLERVGPQIDRLFISGDADRQTLLLRHPGLDPAVVPNAVPVPAAVDRADDGQTLLFVGSFGYAPNLEGIRWFVTEILPLVPATTRVRVRIVGRDGPDALRALGRDRRVEIVGEVDDLTPFYRSAALAIAPLRSGGGTRLKVIEALARGVPVVATTTALRGIEVGDDMVWRADDAPTFAAAVAAALADTEGRAARGLAGHRFAAERHDRERVVASLAVRFAALLELDR